MTKEDKELLLKDLCARLPYGVIVETRENGYNWSGELKFFGNGKFGYDINRPYELERIKPYLRPISSMTEEERAYYFAIDENHITCTDWLNKKMFDCRGLIPMGLAIEAPEGMYK